MPSTVDQIVGKFQRKFPECDPTTALDFFQSALKRVLSRVQVRNNVQYVSVVNGTREYALDASIFKIHSAYLEQGVGSSIPMQEYSTDELDVLRWGWRQTNFLGDPVEYYISSMAVSAGGSDTQLSSAQNCIGFNPIPAITTSGTYPRVALYCTAYLPLSGSETVPSNLLDDNIFLYRMYEQWGEWTQDAQSAQYWSALADKQIDLNHEHITAMQSQGASGFIMTSAFMPTRTV